MHLSKYVCSILFYSHYPPHNANARKSEFCFFAQQIMRRAKQPLARKCSLSEERARNCLPFAEFPLQRKILLRVLSAAHSLHLTKKPHGSSCVLLSVSLIPKTLRSLSAPAHSQHQPGIFYS